MTATATSIYLQFTTWTTSSTETTVLVGPHSINGQMGLPVVQSQSTIVDVWSHWEGFTTTTSFSEMTAAFGPWSISTTSNTIKLIYKTLVTQINPYISCACVPYSFSFVLAMYSSWANNAQQSVTRTYSQMVVGGTYSVSFWYATTTENGYAPNNFQVTLGGTTVWNTVPTSTSWVRHATALCRAALCRVLLCCAVLCCVVLCCAVLCCVMLGWDGMGCIVRCGAV
jgi:hypothetical protein